jgi:ribosomal protein S18 acetylase RimI-like enzyme
MITLTAANDVSVAAQIHALCQAAYALEGKRIGCAEFPPLRETVEDLRVSSDQFLVFHRLKSLVGALSFKTGRDAVTITRLVVHPAHERNGIATALLDELERRFTGPGRIGVATAEANLPAVRLYERLGYERTSFSDTKQGIRLIRFAKLI